MNDIRMAKFQLLIEDINSKLMRTVYGSGSPISVSSRVNTCLAMIYDYNRLNAYAKIIMEKSNIILASSEWARIDEWSQKHNDINEFKDSKACIKATKEFIKYCRDSDTFNNREGYKFIFWALMILTVDKTEAQEHLSLICDFVRMLRISNAELEDIVYVIKFIYNVPTTQDHFETDMLWIFGDIWNLYA